MAMVAQASESNGDGKVLEYWKDVTAGHGSIGPNLILRNRGDELGGYSRVYIDNQTNPESRSDSQFQILKLIALHPCKYPEDL
jgi:hypothetical protein